MAAIFSTAVSPPRTSGVQLEQRRIAGQAACLFGLVNLTGGRRDPIYCALVVDIPALRDNRIADVE